MRVLKKLLIELKKKSYEGINEKGKNGNTILHLAGKYGSGETTRMLIEKGADVNAKNNKGEIPLHKAAYKGNVASVMQMIKGRWNIINTMDNRGSTPLHHAARMGAREDEKELIKEGKRLAEVVEILILRGADVEGKNKYGLKAENYAQGKWRRKVKEVFKKYRGKRNKSECDMEEIEIGVYEKKLKEIKERGYEGINEKIEQGVTIMHLAGELGSVKLIEELIEKGGDVEGEDECGRRPIHFAAAGRNREIVKVLIDKGVDIDASTNGGYTALHYACMTGAEGVVRELVKRGAEINPVNRFGITPIYYGNKSIRKILERNGGRSKMEELKKEEKNLEREKEEVMKKIMRPLMREKITSIEEIKKRNKKARRAIKEIDKKFQKLRKKRLIIDEEEE